ncbi:MAG: AgmX/PglI C-terminal domain-containing protein [Polyangiaceae bacterium]
MTAVMRSMIAPQGPRVLRVALVRGGKVVEERVLRSHENVTAGANAVCTFVVPDASLPAEFLLFEREGDAYSLHFTQGMSGRVALTNGIFDFALLRNQATRVGSNYKVTLNEDARGKIVLGDVALLFQFVAPPLAHSKPQLPLAVRGGVAASVDWTLTVVAAFSFILHFGVIGTMYSDWMDAPVTESSVQGLVDMMKKIQPPPLEEKADVAPAAVAEQQKAPVKEARETKRAPVTPSTPASATAPSTSVSDAKAAALASRAEQMRVDLLGSFTGSTAVDGALRRSEVPPVDMNAAAEAAKGVAPGGSELRVSANGAPIRVGDTDLRNISGSVKAQTDTHVAGKERTLAAPKFDTQAGVQGMSVPVTGADAVIASLRGRFRSCYQQGIASDPTMAGKVVISAKVGPNGEVESAQVASNTGLSPTVGACIARAVKNAQFAAPGGSGSQLNIPVSFVLQAK